MAISFTEVIDTLVSDSFATPKAALYGLRAQRELYHFQMAIHEFGEEKVVQECANILKDRYRVSYSEASIDAAHRVRAFLELTSGENTFKQVRDNLKK